MDTIDQVVGILGEYHVRPVSLEIATVLWSVAKITEGVDSTSMGFRKIWEVGGPPRTTQDLPSSAE
jgi:hypothetical protein